MFGLLKVTKYEKVALSDLQPIEDGVRINFSAPDLGYVTVIVLKDDVVVGCKSSETPIVNGSIELKLPDSYSSDTGYSVFSFTLGKENDMNRYIGKTTNSIWVESVKKGDVYHFDGDNSKIKGAQVIVIPVIGLEVEVSFVFTGKSTAYHGVIA